MSIIQPESDLSLNVVILGAEIISYLLDANENVIIEKILKKFIFKDSRRNHTLFFDTLTYLYSVGLIKLKDYCIKMISDKLKQRSLTYYVRRDENNGDA